MAASAVVAHDVSVASTSASSGAPGPLTPPAAVRAQQPGWRDPRLWIGVAIVAVSVLVGARVLAGSDDTVAVWAAVGDVGAGDQVSVDDLVARQVRFADDTELAHYLRVDDDLPADARFLRSVGAGELVPGSALGGREDASTVEISLEVDPAQVPTGVAAGSTVDVYVLGRGASTPGRGDGGADDPADESEPALAQVSVVDAPLGGDTFVQAGGRQLVLAVDEDDVAGFYGLVESLEDPVVYVARHR